MIKTRLKEGDEKLSQASSSNLFTSLLIADSQWKKKKKWDNNGRGGKRQASSVMWRSQLKCWEMRCKSQLAGRLKGSPAPSALRSDVAGERGRADCPVRHAKSWGINPALPLSPSDCYRCRLHILTSLHANTHFLCQLAFLFPFIITQRLSALSFYMTYLCVSAVFRHLHFQSTCSVSPVNQASILVLVLKKLTLSWVLMCSVFGFLLHSPLWYRKIYF